MQSSQETCEKDAESADSIESDDGDVRDSETTAFDLANMQFDENNLTNIDSLLEGLDNACDILDEVVSQPILDATP